MANTVMTVTGPVAVDQLGLTLMHEHFTKWQSTMGGRNFEQDLYDLFTTELTEGIHQSGVKAGLIKAATSDPVITEYEKTVIKVSVRVAKEQNVSIITHTDAATVGPAQQDLFFKIRRGSQSGHDRSSE